MAKDIWSGKEPFLQGQKKKISLPSIKLPKLPELRKLPKWVIIAAVVVLILILIVLIYSEKSEEIEVVEENLTANESFEEAEQITEVDIMSGQYYFEPDEIRVNLNDNVVLNIESDDINYTFIIPGFFVSREIKQGGTITTWFTANKAGSYVFKAKEHDNMNGVIIVE